ncbi:MAG: polyphenol oxidase family protein [Candidatus Scatovivens sp.]
MKDLSNENIIHIKKDNIEYLQFRKLLEYSDVLEHAYSIGLDVNFRTNRKNNLITEEEKKLSIDSYKKICEGISCNYLNLVKPNQDHTDNIKIVKSKIEKEKPDFNLEFYNKTDGLITNEKNIILSTTNADCVLLIFFDPDKKVIANIHSGWKGTLSTISTKAVEKMINEFKCDPQDIICCICPSIRKCHFEVDKDVMELFYNKFKNLKQIDDIIEKKSGKEKWLIDTVLINKIILEQIGIKKENIIDSKICSVCNSDILHSYRVEKEKYGLETAIIGLK